MTGANIGNIAHGRTGVTVARAKAVAALYDELWDTFPPKGCHRDKIAYSRSLRYAAEAGWVAPMAWDDDTIDNPDATPDLGERSGRTGGAKFDFEDIEFLLDQEPFTLPQLAHRFSVGRSAIEHACARNDRRDLLARMARNLLAQETAA